MKIVTVIGARPQFVKAALISEAIRRSPGVTEVLIHTGQHYDCNMSGNFFTELGLARPHYNLGVSGPAVSGRISKMMRKLESVLKVERPDIVLVYGDTDSTLAGALSALDARVPVAHVEAGLRSFDKSMPEEFNRVLTDAVSDILFCPTKEAVANLKKENIEDGVYQVGDIMYELALKTRGLALKRSRILERLGVAPKSYILVTVHRQANADNRNNLENIVSALCSVGKIVVFPVHPRTEKMLVKFGLLNKLRKENIILTSPLGYLDMVALEINADKIATDSGGVQKEAYFFKIPCITLRDRTEWVETAKNGWNILTGTSKEKIVKAMLRKSSPGRYVRYYGDGHTSERIVRILKKKG